MFALFEIMFNFMDKIKCPLINNFVDFWVDQLNPYIETAKINICIEGNISSGKSSLLDELAKRGHCVEKQRFLKIRELIKNFYDTKGKRTSPEVYKLQKEIYQIYKDTWFTHYGKETKVRFVEASMSSVNVFTKRSHDLGEINDEDFKKLNKECNLKKDKMIPDLIIYIHAKPEICHDRILQSNERELEKNIELGYLEEINSYYEKFINSTKIETVKINNSNISIDQLADQIENILKNKKYF
jgi:deoxyadenosine/deoxycytidine kinase